MKTENFTARSASQCNAPGKLLPACARPINLLSLAATRSSPAYYQDGADAATSPRCNNWPRSVGQQHSHSLIFFVCSRILQLQSIWCTEFLQLIQCSEKRSSYRPDSSAAKRQFLTEVGRGRNFRLHLTDLTVLQPRDISSQKWVAGGTSGYKPSSP
jgi:hypothetical protein